jgi:uncharacterized membrane protein
MAEMETLVALFDSYENAHAAVESLKEAGFKDEWITLLTREKTYASDPEQPETRENTIRMAGKGAASGGVVGGLSGLIVGLGAIVVPGLGPVLAGGALAAALVSTAAGAGIGAAAGGAVGALVGQGISEEEAQIYAEGVKRGGLLVMVRVEDGRTEIAQTLLKNANVVDIDTAAEEWRSSGWTRFEDTVEPDDTYPRMWGGMHNQR